MKKLVSILLTGGLLFAMLVPANAKPVNVWEDPADDAGTADTGPVPVYTQGGLDLVSGAIDRAGANLEFTVTHAAMPPVGSIPETFRFLWAFNVDGKDFRITAKTADVGKPDALASTGTDRVGQVDTAGHFRLEGNCQAGATVGVVQPINCEPLAKLEGAIDSAALTLTVVIPMKLVKAKPGSKIVQGAGDAAGICLICWVSHLAERSHEQTIVDSAVQTKTYKVPR
jgi:hypothetical protein